MILNSHKLKIAVFTATIFLSAFLLFLIQPMFARMALPVLGGSSSVWNICMVFFQGTLLAGYLYTDITIGRLNLRTQLAIHILIFGACLFSLPPAISLAYSEAPETGLSLWLLALLSTSVGIPFFINSTASPLLQKWFSWSGHTDSSDPYFLYSASNIGSLLSLVAYPFVIERMFTLDQQLSLWSMGLLLLFTMTLFCAAIVLKTSRENPSESVGNNERDDQTRIVEGSPSNVPAVKQRLWWVLLAFIPSSLLLGTTTHITTDIASVPLLWIVPLVIYLLSFIIAFSSKTIPQRFLVKVLSMISLVLSIIFFLAGLQWALLLHLIFLFAAGTGCHQMLVENRPHVDHLTSFYLYMSIGGVLGGIFNALIAPAIFTSVAEYPLVLVLANLVIASDETNWDYRNRDVRNAWICGGAMLLSLSLLGPLELWNGMNLKVIVLAISSLAVYSFLKNRVAFASGLAFLLIGGFLHFTGANVVFDERSFFGVHRVKEDHQLHIYKLLHSTTIHGAQKMSGEHRSLPLMYYHPTGPAGQVISSVANESSGQTLVVGTAGLGVGSLAWYGRTGDDYRFYEIDPSVIHIATKLREFTFITDARAGVSIIQGDARNTLSKEPDGTFDILIIDVFSGDSIPVHLMTTEAFTLYKQKLRPDGILLVHMSNRYLNLEPVLSGILTQCGLVGRICKDDNVTPEEELQGKCPSVWSCSAKNSKVLNQHLVSTEKSGRTLEWQNLATNEKVPAWTDNYSNILDILHF